MIPRKGIASPANFKLKKKRGIEHIAVYCLSQKQKYQNNYSKTPKTLAVFLGRINIIEAAHILQNNVKSIWVFSLKIEKSVIKIDVIYISKIKSSNKNRK